jgi:two-component system nitrogen regulation sensor histidine kinase GlnL
LRPIDQQLRRARGARGEQQQANRELIRNWHTRSRIRSAASAARRSCSNANWRPRRCKEYTQVIIKEADRLQDLMQRLLTPSRDAAVTQVNIHEILERVRA